MSQAVILAAGEGSRLWPLNQRHKSLLRVIGRPLIWHTLESLKKAGVKESVIIQGPGRDIEQELGENIKYVIQLEPKGMGDAVMGVRGLISESFLVLHAHKVNAGDCFKPMIEKFKKSRAQLILLGVKTKQPQLYGMLAVEGDRLKGLIEKPEPGKEPSDIRVIGTYLLPRNFFEYYKRIPEHQYAFEDALDLYMKENEARLVMVEEEPTSFKYPWQLFEITKSLFDSSLKAQKIHPTAKIAKNVIIEGNVHVEKNARIFENAIIKGPCYIGKDCIIGNHALVRDYTNLEEGVIVGAHAEVTRCIFQKNTHVHSGYFGDSIFGEGCRVGAGTVTGNVRLDRGEIKSTGLTSLGAIVGQNTNIGINVSLMPGVLIGSNCLIGPASVVFENLQDNTTFYTKFKNETR